MSDNNNDALTLVGMGERTVKLGFVEIHVYSLELYVDARACRACLSPNYSNMDLNGLLREPLFYSDFTSGKFEKRFQLSFCRTLSQEKLVGGFDAPLLSRSSDEHQEEAKLLLSKLVPPQGVGEGDILTLVCHEDGETLTGLYKSCGSSDDTLQEQLVEVKSGGTGGAWLALQNIYFDDDTQLPTIRVSAISQLPNVLLEGDGDTMKASSTRPPSQQEIEQAVEQEFTNAPNKKTWSEFAGRTSGKEGYKFGDLTLGVVTAMGLRKAPGKPVERGQLSLSSGSDDTKNKHDATLTNLQQQVEQLQNKVEQLESENAELQQSVVDTEMRLEATFPFRIVAALAVVEAAFLLLQTIGDVYFSSLQKFQLYVVIALLLGVYKQYVERKETTGTKKKKSQVE